MNKEKRIIQEYHHHTYGWDKLVTQLLFLLIIITIISAIGQKITEDENIYDQCTDSCSQKHFMGYAMGNDVGNKYTSSQGRTSVKVYNPTVKEFDRTYCIKDCNDMYLKLRGKE